MSDDMRERAALALLDDLGPHNGMGNPDPAGSYRAHADEREMAAQVWDAVAVLARAGTPSEGIVMIAEQNAAAIRALATRKPPR